MVAALEGVRAGVEFLEGPKGSRERRERKEGMPEGPAFEFEPERRLEELPWDEPRDSEDMVG